MTSATLRIYANSASSAGYEVFSVSDNTWTETGITYSNAPSMQAFSPPAMSGTFSANTWTSVDVTSYITGNGVYNLAFSTTSNTNISFSSREGANAPQLVIETSSGPTVTPSLTSTPGPSLTPTRTPTPGATNTPTLPPTATPTAPPPFSNATFVYDGDGKRVKSTINGMTTTYFVGSYYEVSGSTITKYYYAGSQRIAMRTNGTLNYLLGDHLGSTSLITDASGNLISETRYKAWGEVRYASGNTPTKYQYTGQFNYESDFGLYFYNARWYDSYLNQFTQPDTIVPDPYNAQDWNRYAYVRYNPVRYTDPTGHKACAEEENGRCYTEAEYYNLYMKRLDSSKAKHPKDLNLSTKGREYIINQEGGNRDQPYNDGPNGTGNCTVGYGFMLYPSECTGPTRKWYREHPLTTAEADEWADRIIADIEELIEDTVDVKLTQSQFDALVSYIYNSGGEPGHWYQDKQISEKLNRGQYYEAATVIDSGPYGGNKVPYYPGVERRGHQEAIIFLTGWYP